MVEKKVRPMVKLIMTVDEIVTANLCLKLENNDRFISLSLLHKEIQKKYDESYNLPGDLKDIRDLGRMDSLRWLSSLLEV